MANIGVFFCTEDEILTHMYEKHDGKQQGVIFNPQKDMIVYGEINLRKSIEKSMIFGR